MNRGNSASHMGHNLPDVDAYSGAFPPPPPPPPAPPKLEDLPPHLHTLGALEDHLAAEEASRRATDAYLAEHYAESSSGESDIDWRAEVPRKW